MPVELAGGLQERKFRVYLLLVDTLLGLFSVRLISYLSLLDMGAGPAQNVRRSALYFIFEPDIGPTCHTFGAANANV